MVTAKGINNLLESARSGHMAPAMVERLAKLEKELEACGNDVGVFCRKAGLAQQYIPVVERAIAQLQSSRSESQTQAAVREMVRNLTEANDATARTDSASSGGLPPSSSSS
jgi:hypothetical protein